MTDAPRFMEVGPTGRKTTLSEFHPPTDPPSLPQLSLAEGDIVSVDGVGRYRVTPSEVGGFLHGDFVSLIDLDTSRPVAYRRGRLTAVEP